MTKMSKLWDDIERQNDEILSQSDDVKSQHFKVQILTKGIIEIIIQNYERQNMTSNCCNFILNDLIYSVLLQLCL